MRAFGAGGSQSKHGSFGPHMRAAGRVSDSSGRRVRVGRGDAPHACCARSPSCRRLLTMQPYHDYSPKPLRNAAPASAVVARHRTSRSHCTKTSEC